MRVPSTPKRGIVVRGDVENVPWPDLTRYVYVVAGSRSFRVTSCVVVATGSRALYRYVPSTPYATTSRVGSAVVQVMRALETDGDASRARADPTRVNAA